MPLKIAIIQMDIAFGNPTENYNKVSAKVMEAMKSTPDVIILPELWTTGYDLTRLDVIADQNGRQTITFISDLAKKYTVNIVAGSVAKKTEQGVTNTMYSFNRSGELLGEYSKVHLFRLMDEEKHLIAGNSEGFFDIEGHKAAGFICYDIRFPEWLRKHVLAGSKLLFVSAEWPIQRLDHWRTLLLARAIENQSYVVACNRAGKDPNNTFAGHSMIIDPWGEIIAEADTAEQILIGEIDLDSVDEIRSRIPVFEDRRTQLY